MSQVKPRWCVGGLLGDSWPCEVLRVFGLGVMIFWPWSKDSLSGSMECGRAGGHGEELCEGWRRLAGVVGVVGVGGGWWCICMLGVGKERSGKLDCWEGLWPWSAEKIMALAP